MDDAQAQLIDQAQTDIDRGHFESAQQQLEGLAADSQTRGDDACAAQARWLLASCYRAQGRLQDAARAYALVAEHHDRELIDGSLPPTRAERLVGELRTVGAFLIEIGHTDDAETVLYSALSASQQHLTQGNLETGRVLLELGRVCAAGAEIADAEEHYRRSVEAFRAASSSVPAVIFEGLGWALYRLGDVLAAQNRLPEAEPLLLESYAAMQQRYGQGAPELGYPLVSLARLYVAGGQLEQGETFFKRSITAGAGRPDQDALEVAIRMSELAELYWSTSQYEQAEALFERVIDRMTDTVGSDTGIVANILQRIADLNWDLGRLEPAVTACERALEMLDDVDSLAPLDDVAIATVLHQLASIRFEQGAIEAARGSSLRALEIFQEHLPESAERASTLNLLGQIERTSGSIETAKHHLTDSIALMVRAAGEADPRVITSVNNLAEMCLEGGIANHAEVILRWSVNVSARALGMRHPQVELAVEFLVQVLTVDGRPDEAAELLVWARGGV